MPVSITPTRAPAPWLTAYEPVLLAWMARLSHWQAPSGSGLSGDGPYSAAQVAASVPAGISPGTCAPDAGASTTVEAATSATTPSRIRCVRVIGDSRVVVGWCARGDMDTRAPAPVTVRCRDTSEPGFVAWNSGFPGPVLAPGARRAR